MARVLSTRQALKRNPRMMSHFSPSNLRASSPDGTGTPSWNLQSPAEPNYDSITKADIVTIESQLKNTYTK